MARLAAVFGALLALLLVPLALAPTTAWLLLPAHLVFTVLVSCAALGEGWVGHPGRARAWGGSYLVASVLMVAALELGGRVHTPGYTWLPWTCALIWGWTAPLAAGLGGMLGEQRRRHLIGRAVAARKGGRRRDGPSACPSAS